MISFLLFLLGVLGVLFVILLAATIVLLAVTGIRGLIRSWRRAHTVIAQTQAGFAPEPDDALAMAITCPLCRDGGHGRCVCTTDCGHRHCTFDHTTVSLFSAEDAAYLRGLGMDEGDR